MPCEGTEGFAASEILKEKADSSGETGPRNDRFFAAAQQATEILRFAQSGQTHFFRGGLVRELQRGLRGGAAGNFRGDLIDGQDLFGEASASHESRHAPDDASGFVLHDHGSAGGAERFAAFQSILPHAGEDYAEGARAVYSGDGAEQDVHGWAAEIFARALVSSQNELVLFPLHNHMKIAWGDPDVAGDKRLAGPAFAHGKRALAREAPREEFRENRRHVLGDDHRQREIRRDPWQKSGESVRSSGGHSDGDDLQRAYARRRRVK